MDFATQSSLYGEESESQHLAGSRILHEMQINWWRSHHSHQQNTAGSVPSLNREIRNLADVMEEVWFQSLSQGHLSNVVSFYWLWSAMSILTTSMTHTNSRRKSHLQEHRGGNENLNWVHISIKKLDELYHTSTPWGTICPKQKGLGALLLSALKYSFITLWKDSREQEEPRKGRVAKMAWVSDREALHEYKKFWLMQSKLDERGLGNGGLHGVMPWRTVKSSSQEWSTHSSSVNPSVSVLSSPTIHPITRLYLCFSDEDKGKHSLICSFLS